MNGELQSVGVRANDQIEIEECDSDDGRINIPSSSQFPYYLSRRNSGRSLRSFRHHERREPNIIRRLLKKNGKSTVQRKKIPDHWFRYLLDLGNTLINTRWKWTIVTLASLFFLTWLIFACAWMLIGRSENDSDPNVPTATCLTGIRGFLGYFLFSVETQSTIGYGERVIGNNCPEAVALLCIQVIFGSGLCGCLVSIVYAKMTSPSKFRPTMCFSKKAVVCERDGDLSLIFRIRDDGSRYQVSTKVNAYVVQNRAEEPYLKSIKLEPTGILIWPVDVVHKITHSSPFYDLSAKDLILKRFEIIVTMEGVCGVTGKASKTSTSYMSTEIRWGSRFVPCVKYKNSGYFVDHKFFNATEEHLTPLCSAKRLLEVVHEIGLNRELEELYTPRTVYSAILNREDWPEIVEEQGGNNDEFLDGSSGIGSMMSPVSTRSNKLITVADIHCQQELEHNRVSQESAGIQDENDVVLRNKKSARKLSPYARRKPFWFEFRSSSSRDSTSSKRSSRQMTEQLRNSLQSYMQFFTRQTSKNVTETDL